MIGCCSQKRRASNIHGAQLIVACRGASQTKSALYLLNSRDLSLGDRETTTRTQMKRSGRSLHYRNEWKRAGPAGSCTMSTRSRFWRTLATGGKRGCFSSPEPTGEAVPAFFGTPAFLAMPQTLAPSSAFNQISKRNPFHRHFGRRTWTTTTICSGYKPCGETSEAGNEPYRKILHARIRTVGINLFEWCCQAQNPSTIHPLNWRVPWALTWHAPLRPCTRQG